MRSSHFPGLCANSFNIYWVPRFNSTKVGKLSTDHVLHCFLVCCSVRFVQDDTNQPLWPAWPLVKPRRLWHTHSIEISEISKVLMFFFTCRRMGFYVNLRTVFCCFYPQAGKRWKGGFTSPFRIITGYQNCITMFHVLILFLFLHSHAYNLLDWSKICAGLHSSSPFELKISLKFLFFILNHCFSLAFLIP